MSRLSGTFSVIFVSRSTDLIWLLCKRIITLIVVDLTPAEKGKQGIYSAGAGEALKLSAVTFLQKGR